MHNMQPYVRDAILGLESVIYVLETRGKQITPARLIEVLGEIADGLANPHKTPDQGSVIPLEERQSVKDFLQEKLVGTEGIAMVKTMNEDGSFDEKPFKPTPDDLVPVVPSTDPQKGQFQIVDVQNPTLRLAVELLERYPELEYVGRPGIICLPDPDHITEGMIDGSRDLWRYFEHRSNERCTMDKVLEHLNIFMDTSILPQWLHDGAKATPPHYLDKSGRATLCYILTVAGFQREKEKQDDDSQRRAPVSDGPEQG